MGAANRRSVRFPLLGWLSSLRPNRPVGAVRGRSHRGVTRPEKSPVSPSTLQSLRASLSVRGETPCSQFSLLRRFPPILRAAGLALAIACSVPPGAGTPGRRVDRLADLRRCRCNRPRSSRHGVHPGRRPGRADNQRQPDRHLQRLRRGHGLSRLSQLPRGIFPVAVRVTGRRGRNVAVPPGQDRPTTTGGPRAAAPPSRQRPSTPTASPTTGPYAGGQIAVGRPFPTWTDDRIGWVSPLLFAGAGIVLLAFVIFLQRRRIHSVGQGSSTRHEASAM